MEYSTFSACNRLFPRTSLHLRSILFLIVSVAGSLMPLLAQNQYMFKLSDDCPESDSGMMRDANPDRRVNPSASWVYYSFEGPVTNGNYQDCEFVQMGKLVTLDTQSAGSRIYWGVYHYAGGGIISGESDFRNENMAFVINPYEKLGKVVVKQPIKRNGELAENARLFCFGDNIPAPPQGNLFRAHYFRNNSDNDFVFYGKPGFVFRYLIENTSCKDASGRYLAHLMYVDSVQIGSGADTILVDYREAQEVHLRFKGRSGEDLNWSGYLEHRIEDIYRLPYSGKAPEACPLLRTWFYEGAPSDWEVNNGQNFWQKDDESGDVFNYMRFFAFPGKHTLEMMHPPFAEMEWSGSFAEEYLNAYRRESGYRVDFEVEAGKTDVYVDFSKWHKYRVILKNAAHFFLGRGFGARLPFGFHARYESPEGDPYHFETDVEFLPSGAIDYVSEEDYPLSGNDHIRTFRTRECFSQVAIRPTHAGFNDTLGISLPTQTLRFADGEEIVYDLGNYRPVRMVFPDSVLKYCSLVLDGEIKDYSLPDSLDAFVAYFPVGTHKVELLGEDGKVMNSRTEFEVIDSFDQTVKFEEEDFQGLVVLFDAGGVSVEEAMKFTLTAVEDGSSYEMMLRPGEPQRLLLPQGGAYRYVFGYGQIPAKGSVQLGAGMEHLTISLQDYKCLTLSPYNNIDNIRCVSEGDTLTILSKNIILPKDSIICGTLLPSGSLLAQVIAPKDSRILFDLKRLGTYHDIALTLERDSLILLPGTSTVRVRFVRGGESEPDVKLYAQDFNGCVVTDDSRGTFNLYPGVYKAVSQSGEVLYFEVAAEHLIIDFENPPTPPAAIEEIERGNSGNTVDVYSLRGICLRRNVPLKDALEGLSPGLYIVDGKKVFTK